MKAETIQIDDDSETPRYLQLAEALRRAIAAGTAAAGERLPSIRRLSDAVRANPATVVAAYRILEKEGLVEARAGSGVYVREKPAGSAGTPGGADAGELAELAAGRVRVPAGAWDLAAGAPSPDLFPAADFRRLLDEVLERDGGWAFGYQESAGWEPFRAALAGYLEDAHGIKSDVQDVRVVSGAQQGIDLAAKALLGPRDSVLVESPTYRGAVAVFWSRGAAAVPVPAGQGGMDEGALEAVVRERRPRLAYVIPRYQNPTTACWSEEGLRRLLDLAERHDFYVLEDDILSDLCYGPRPSPSCAKAMDDSGRVVYLRSFSKVLMPGLRLGAMVVPRALRDRFEAAKRATDIATDGLVQRALELYLKRGMHAAQLERLRAHYGEVYARCLDAFAPLRALGAELDPPGGGLHFWIRLPPPATGTALRRAALARGCVVVPEAVYADAPEGAADAHVRASFAALGPDDAAPAFSALAAALADVLRAPNALGGDAVRQFL